MNAPPKHFYEFGPFRIDTVKRLLLNDGEPVALKSKCFEMLLALVEARGEVLEKDELMRRVWPDMIVEESNITVYISMLRRALGESPQEHHYIVTISRRGYSFVAEVKEVWEGDAKPNEQEPEEAPTSTVSSPPISWFSGFIPRRLRYAPLLVVGGLLLLGTGLAISNWRDTRPPIRSIAVLPFRLLNVNDDPTLGLQISEVLSTKLGGVRQLSVRPPSAVNKYKDHPADSVTAGREQQVDAVLEGSIHQQAGEHIRVTVQLVSVKDGAQLWSDQFDGTRREVFKIEDDISQRVTRALALSLSGEEQRHLTKHYSEIAAAREFYSKGRDYWKRRDAEGLRKAIEQFKQAIALDNAFALAYTGLADTYAFLGSAYFDPNPPREDMLEARRAALTALQLDDTLAEAHCALAFVVGFYDWDWPQAKRELKRALELKPNYATAHQRYGWYYMAMGQLDEALAEMKIAHSLDPNSAIIGINVGAVLYYQRKYDEALGQFRRASERHQDFLLNHVWLGWNYAAKGAFPEAIAEFQRESSPWEQSRWGLGYVHALTGNGNAAREILRQLQELSRQRYISPSAFILIHLSLGEKERALDWLEKAVEERDFDMCLLKVDPKLDSLRADPRFSRLLQSVGLRRDPGEAKAKNHAGRKSS